MDDRPDRGIQNTETKLLLNHYYAGTFFMFLNKICVEMNHRFGESTIEIWTCFLCLHPKNNNFSRFYIDSLVRVAQIYDVDFYTSEIL